MGGCHPLQTTPTGVIDPSPQTVGENVFNVKCMVKSKRLMQCSQGVAQALLAFLHF